jgi:hypothetical protein
LDRLSERWSVGMNISGPRPVGGFGGPLREGVTLALDLL